MNPVCSQGEPKRKENLISVTRNLYVYSFHWRRMCPFFYTAECLKLQSLRSLIDKDVCIRLIRYLTSGNLKIPAFRMNMLVGKKPLGGGHTIWVLGFFQESISNRKLGLRFKLIKSQPPPVCTDFFTPLVYCIKVKYYQEIPPFASIYLHRATVVCGKYSLFCRYLAALETLGKAVRSEVEKGREEFAPLWWEGLACVSYERPSTSEATL